MAGRDKERAVEGSRIPVYELAKAERQLAPSGCALELRSARLTPATLNAVTTNRSHLISTALGAKTAALLTREWGGSVEPEVIVNLPRYTSIASITLDGEVSPPFLVRGVPVEELFPDSPGDRGRAALERVIDGGTDRRPVKDTLAELDRLDDRIVRHLGGADGGTGSIELSERPA